MRPTNDRIRHHVTREPTSVWAVMREHFGLDQAKIEELMQLGAVYHDRRRVFADRQLKEGAYLRIHLEPRRFPVDTIDWKATVVSREREFLIVNKPFGIPVHATLDNNLDNVIQQLRLLTGDTLLVTQRLDIPVGGLVLIARNPDFQRRFNRRLLERALSKKYSALVESPAPLGLHVHYMEPSERSPKRVILEERAGWQRCELSVLACRTVKTGFELEIELHTGRTHQIRAQLAALGSPIQGDRMYGAGAQYQSAYISLFAEKLAWKERDGVAWNFELKPPWRC